MFSGYFTHPMLEKRIENLLNEQTEMINSDVKVISEEIFQRWINITFSDSIEKKYDCIC